MSKYETFSDPAYYDMWCVREVGEKRWGYCFHVMSENEAKGIADALAQRDRLIQALTPSGDTKRVYMGEVRDDAFTTVQGEDGEWEEVNLRPYVSWTAIKAVMEMIRKEAGL